MTAHGIDLGRRLPYLLLGAAVAVVVMCLLPNAGSFGLSVGGAMIFGFIALMFLDTSINMAMQPFKMLVGDQVNERQKGLAYSIQSFLCNAGSLVGYLAPITLTAIGVSNLAPTGQVPDAVTYSFYIGAAVLILCVIYSFATIREMPPKEYAEYHGITESQKEEKKRHALPSASCSENILDSWSRSVLLLGSLPLYVDLHSRCDCRYCMGYN